MSCEHLVCAHCAGPVVEGRCSAGRGPRDHVHNHGPANITPQLLLAAALLLLLGLLIATHVLP